MPPKKAQPDIVSLLQSVNEKQDAMMEKISAIHTRQEVVQVKLERVEALAEKTNGRVTRLEGWRNYIAGGMSLAGAGIAFILAKITGK